MSGSFEGKPPLIFIEGPKDEQVAIEEDDTKETSEEDDKTPQTVSKMEKISGSISFQHLHVETGRRPSTNSSIMSSASMQSISSIAIGYTRSRKFMMLVITWVVFMLGLMLGVLAAFIFLCDPSLGGGGHNQTHFMRRNLW